MKKTIIVMLAAVAISFAAAPALKAQDVITTIDGKELKVSIVEEENAVVKFRNIGSSVVRDMPESNIFMIKYEDGSKRVITRPTQQQRPQPQPTDGFDDNGGDVSPNPGGRGGGGDPPIKPATPSFKHGYVGLSLGSGAFGDETETFACGILGVNAGYLFTRMIGAQASWSYWQSLEYSDFYFTDARVGPLFSFGKNDKGIAFDLRPSLVYLSSDLYGISVSEWGFGAGVTGRYNLRNIAITAGLDVDIASQVLVGFTLGIDFRLP